MEFRSQSKAKSDRLLGGGKTLIQISVITLAAAVFLLLQDIVAPLLPSEAAELFLRTGRVVSREPVGEGITASERVTLSDGERELRAIWKTIDEIKHGSLIRERGGIQRGFTDSYKYEIAAYEVNKLLGLDLVPPTVESTIGGQSGSLQLWVDGAITELERRQRELPYGDGTSTRMCSLRLFQQLIYDSDRNNIRNIIYDPNCVSTRLTIPAAS